MLKFANRVKVNTSTTGTGAITLGATVVGYQSFSDAGILNGDEVRYTIEDGNSWEIGTGVYSSGTMTRSVIESSNSNALLNLSGNAFVFLTVAGQDLQVLDSVVPNTRTISTGTGLTGGGNLTANRTLALNAGSIASLALADTAVQPTRSITAGTGLTGGGNLSANRTLALSTGSIASLALADTAVQPARTITAGTGLTGGGNLSANRTIALSAGSIASLALADTSVQPARSISTGTGLTGGGDLSTNRTIALTGQALALHNLTGTGLVARTGTNTFAVRSVAAGDGITVTNGAGTAGNPTISADTTLARSAVTLTAGAGLTGGGDLSANRSFAVDSTVVRTSGNQTIAGEKTFTSRLISSADLQVRHNTADQGFGISNEGSSVPRFGFARAGGSNGAGIIWRQNNANTARSHRLLFEEGGAIRADVGFFAGSGSGLTDIPATAITGLSVPSYYEVFTASGTWTKPDGLDDDTVVFVEGWGAGGGGDTDSNGTGGGGGGGAYARAAFRAADLPSSVAVTVGAGGLAGSTATAGGNTTFGALLTAYGGGPGRGASDSLPMGNGGGGGGGAFESGAAGRDDGPAPVRFGASPSPYGGGAGGGRNTPNGSVTRNGEDSEYGGAGGGVGGAQPGTGGTSKYGGNGGAGATNNNAASPGQIPGGGGGGGEPGGDGARGELRVWI